MANLMTHKDITDWLEAKGKKVDVATVTRWGRNGLLGEAVIAFPRHYKKSDVLAALRSMRKFDKRLKLSDTQVQEILKKSEKGVSRVKLSKAYGVHETTISLIVNGRRRRK